MLESLFRQWAERMGLHQALRSFPDDLRRAADRSEGAAQLLEKLRTPVTEPARAGRPESQP